MPSVFSIIAAAIDNRNEPVGRDLVPFRSINPLDCFYLLDPEPDLEPDPDNDIDDGLLAIDYEEELAKHLHFKVLFLSKSDKITQEEMLQIV